jgi:hypothetical protein
MAAGAIGHNNELKLPWLVVYVQVGPGLAPGWLLNNQTRMKRFLLSMCQRKDADECQGEDEGGLFHVLFFKVGRLPFIYTLNIQK